MIKHIRCGIINGLKTEVGLSTLTTFSSNSAKKNPRRFIQVAILSFFRELLCWAVGGATNKNFLSFKMKQSTQRMSVQDIFVYWLFHFQFVCCDCAPWKQLSLNLHALKSSCKFDKSVSAADCHFIIGNLAAFSPPERICFIFIFFN